MSADNLASDRLMIYTESPVMRNEKPVLKKERIQLLETFSENLVKSHVSASLASC